MVLDNARDLEPLPLAETERNDVSSALSDRMFDVPMIRADRSQPLYHRSAFVCRRLSCRRARRNEPLEQSVSSLWQLVHSTDLERWPQLSLPFVYLNTCELGEARFLGGGRGRGLAFTFAELGAPAVLAYTKSVFDDVSAACQDVLSRIYAESCW